MFFDRVWQRRDAKTRQMLPKMRSAGTSGKPHSRANACAPSLSRTATARSKARSRGSASIAQAPLQRARSRQRPTCPHSPAPQSASRTPRPSKDASTTDAKGDQGQ